MKRTFYIITKASAIPDSGNDGFKGGADNIVAYVWQEFLKMEEYKEGVDEVKFFEGTHSMHDFEKDLKKNDIVFIDSTQLDSPTALYRRMHDCLRRSGCRIYMYLHQICATTYDIYVEDYIGPSVQDYRNLGIYRKMSKEFGVTWLCSNDTQRIINERLCGKTKLLVIDRKHSFTRNSNPVVVDNSKLPIRERVKKFLLKKYSNRNFKPNNVLFMTGYYAPYVGVEVVFEAIKKTDLHDFEWYIVGRPFDAWEKDISDRLQNFYKEVTERPDVHMIEFIQGEEMQKLLTKMNFNLQLSICDTYAFKALENLSFGNINICLDKLSYLPFYRYGASVKYGDGKVSTISDNLIHTLTDAKEVYKQYRYVIENGMCDLAIGKVAYDATKGDAELASYWIDNYIKSFADNQFEILTVARNYNHDHRLYNIDQDERIDMIWGTGSSVSKGDNSSSH